MQIVLVRPYDDDSIVDTIIVEPLKESAKDFERDWLIAKEAVSEKNPEYNVTDIYKALRKKWQILQVNKTIVTY